MDQIKIGKFIAEMRKAKNLTQMQLAEKMSVTDRAVSKWETGKSMPDSSIMLELCDILGITVNELLVGEKLQMNDVDKKTRKLLVEMAKQKQQADKRLLTAEIVLGVFSTATLIAFVLIAALSNLSVATKIILIVGGFVQFSVCMAFCLLIEQTAGYYECPNCGERYVPTFKAVFLAPHMGRTRQMKCPHCGEKGWHKKVLSKDKDE